MGKKDSSTEMEKIGKLIYKDLGHPALSQVGNAVGSLIRLVALPITFLGLTAEELEKKYAKFIQKTLEKVPEKKRIDPKAVVAAPLLDHVKFVFDEENLSEMFSNLLANAMMENVEAMVHPAFAEMLKQLSPLDAEFMFLYFKDEDIDILYSDRLNRKIAISYAEDFSNTLYFLYSKENIGSSFYYKDCVDGIVFLSSFPCASDSLVNELAIRKLKDVPVINIIIDDSTATSGLMTRLESFVDIIKARRDNG